MEVTKWLKSSGKRVTKYGDSASVQAGNASERRAKRKMRRPTRQPNRGRRSSVPGADVGAGHLTAQEPAPVGARAHPHGGSHALHIRLLGDPAHLPDLEGRAAHRTVGGAGWDNGLLRFWLYLMPGFAFRGLAGFGYARDQRSRWTRGPGWSTS